MRETDTSTSAKNKTDRQLIATTGIWVGTGFTLLAALIAFAVAMSGTWSTGVMCVLMSLGICLSVLAGTAASISVQLALARGARHRADRRGVDLLAGLQGIGDSWADDLAEMRKQHEAAIGALLEAVEQARSLVRDAPTPDASATVRDLTQRIADGPNGHNGAGPRVIRPRDGA